ncbi:MAG: energy transducer TonB [Candidatus Omnitrophota bacterium]
MTYANVTNWWFEAHRRDQRIGFSIAFIIHVLFFLVGGVMFVKTAQYGVVSTTQSIDVNLVDAIEETPAVMKENPEPVQKKEEQTISVKLSEEVSQGVRAQANPNYFQNPPPPYPALAKQMRQEGLVVLSVYVNREGTPTSVEIKQSCGYRLLDQAALKAVNHWKFQPSRVGDLPVESNVDVPIRFRLEE